MSLNAVRIGTVVVLVLVLGLGVYARRALATRVRTFFCEPSSAQPLALLRIVLFAALAWVSARSNAVWWASQPASLRMLPPGWGWLGTTLPIDATLAGHARIVVVAASALAALGVLTRLCAPLAALAAVYLLGTPSFFGKIQHVDHGLMMMTLVLAASPCGDALSLDRAWARRRGVPAPAPSAAYTVPVRLCWLLLGTVYLFPGIWKLWEAGDLWLNGQRLLWELQDEWGQHKHLSPPLRIDHYPWLLSLLGTATLVFELGFFPALFFRPARIVAGLSAVAFHVGVRLFLAIKFYALLPLVVLVDLVPPLARDGPTAERRRSLWPSALAGGLLLAGQFFVGFAQIDTWPIAMHPKFSERGGPKRRAHSNKIKLEPRNGGRQRDVVSMLTKLGGGHGFMRVMLKFDREVARGIPRQKTGRGIVAMLRETGLPLEVGDHIAVYKTSWNTFPIGERTGYVKQLVRRYRVSEDGGLTLE